MILKSVKLILLLDFIKWLLDIIPLSDEVKLLEIILLWKARKPKNCNLSKRECKKSWRSDKSWKPLSLDHECYIDQNIKIVQI